MSRSSSTMEAHAAGTSRTSRPIHKRSTRSPVASAREARSRSSSPSTSRHTCGPSTPTGARASRPAAASPDRHELVAAHVGQPLEPIPGLGRVTRERRRDEQVGGAVVHGRLDDEPAGEASDRSRSPTTPTPPDGMATGIDARTASAPSPSSAASRNPVSPPGSISAPTALSTSARPILRTMKSSSPGRRSHSDGSSSATLAASSAASGAARRRRSDSCARAAERSAATARARSSKAATSTFRARRPRRRCSACDHTAIGRRGQGDHQHVRHAGNGEHHHAEGQRDDRRAHRKWRAGGRRGWGGHGEAPGWRPGSRRAADG